MAKTVMDAVVNNSIFRKDFSEIIAMKREAAAIHPVRLKYKATKWKAGQVLAQDTDLLFDAYSALSGTKSASLVLLDDVSVEDQGATGGALARALSSAYVFTDKLIDYSAQAKTDLKARDIADASGIAVTKF